MANIYLGEMINEMNKRSAGILLISKGVFNQRRPWPACSHFSVTAGDDFL